MDGEAGRILLLAAEPSTRLGLDDRHPVVAHRERSLHGRVDVVRALERPVDGYAAVVARNRDDCLRLDVQLLLVAEPVGTLDDEVRLRESRLQVAPGDLVPGEHAI